MFVLEKIFRVFDVFVITAPDKPAGRGLMKRPNPTREFCLENGIKHEAAESWEEIENVIQSEKPDILVVASYGRIIPKDILDFFERKRRLNVHPSLLPRWRGPAPIHWAILSGDRETGITICTVDEKVDSGDILAQKIVELSQKETYPELEEKLARLGGDLLLEVLQNLDNLTLKPQEGEVSWARLIKKEDGHFSWSMEASKIERMTRAFCVWPRVWANTKKGTLFLNKVEVVEGIGDEPGKIVSVERKGPCVACGKDGLLLIEVQRSGKRPMSGKDWLNGERLKVGDKIEVF